MLMKQFFAAGLAFLLMTGTSAFAAERTVRLMVENMTCASCPFIVQKTLERVPGVTAAEVSYEDQTALVTFDDAQTDAAALTEATAAIGYPSHPLEETVK